MAALRRAAIVQMQQLPHLYLARESQGQKNPRTTPKEESNEVTMSYVQSVRASSPSIFEYISAPFASLRIAAQRRRVYSQTLSELQALSDRDLADLGLHRSLISAVAKEAAYGK
jgi:uncharacterized protein YjiS (DUF1127 family)